LAESPPVTTAPPWLEASGCPESEQARKRTVVARKAVAGKRDRYTMILKSGPKGPKGLRRNGGRGLVIAR
jgi:hypothetical protein